MTLDDAEGPPNRLTAEQKMTRLCETFPALRGAPGVAPWSSPTFSLWMKSGISHGEYCAAAFVLYVWNRFENKFDLDEALACWDPHQHAAFVAWVRSPWWA